MHPTLNKRLLAHPFGIDLAGIALLDVNFAGDVAIICESLSQLKISLEALASGAETLVT
jgi:hypothetical protein